MKSAKPVKYKSKQRTISVVESDTPGVLNATSLDNVVPAFPKGSTFPINADELKRDYVRVKAKKPTGAVKKRKAKKR